MLLNLQKFQVLKHLPGEIERIGWKLASKLVTFCHFMVQEVILPVGSFLDCDCRVPQQAALEAVSLGQGWMANQSQTDEHCKNLQNL